MRIPIISWQAVKIETRRVENMPQLVIHEGARISETATGRTMISGGQISEEEFIEFGKGRQVVEHPNIRKQENE